MVAQFHPLNMAMDSAASRLKQLIDESGMNNVELAERIGKTKSLISTYLNPNRTMGAKFVQLLEDKLGWSSRWIRTGEGPKKINKSTNGNISYVGEPALDYPRRTDFNVTRQISSDKPNMWVVPIKAQAGFAKGFIGRTFAGQIQQVPWPLIQGECFCFEVEGFSMFPDFKPHDYVICTMLADYDWLKPGKAYVFQTFDGIIIKCFNGIVDGKVHLTSINTDADPVAPIDTEELRMIYAIEGKYLKM